MDDLEMGFYDPCGFVTHEPQHAAAADIIGIYIWPFIYWYFIFLIDQK